MSSGASFGQLEGEWFTEVNKEWPGHAFSLKIKKVLCHEKSKIQDILIFESETFGHVLVLNGIIQCTSRDEFSYQEMISHIPLFSHPCPKSVLVVGGGDGGVLREVAKHPMVEEIHLCEIDERVIELSKKYLKQMAVGFDNPKVTVHIQDGMEFMVHNKKKFDVIITDSSDPTGPGEVLFENSYFIKVKEALNSGGIMCLQSDCLWLDLELIERIVGDMRKLFPVAKYASISVPTYTSGQIGIMVASKDKDMVFENPTRTISDAEADSWKLRYYDTQVHKAAFVLPRFATQKLRRL